MSFIKNYVKRTIAAVLAIVFVFSVMIPVSSAVSVPNTEKEEVVYINLNANGSVKEINVVNIFDLDSDGHIIDYGEYESLRNMTTTDEIGYSNDVVTIDAKAGKLYYEGKLDTNVMPWNISIRYFMDGKEYSPDEIAGMSGTLMIAISITQNTVRNGNFFDGFALQASLTFDTNKFHNIVSENATIANVGSSKQLTYTILPGNGADIEITADVTDFEMDGLSVNGIPLNLDIEIDDAELMDQVTELLDAIEQLDDGAADINDGVAALQSGIRSGFSSGISRLKRGVVQLRNGIGVLRIGGSSLQNGAAELNIGAIALDEGIQSLNTGVGQIQTALNALDEQSPTLVKGSAGFKSALSKLQTALNDVSVSADDLSALTSASSEIKSGIDALVTGVTSLKESVSFDAYKSTMLKNGLDVDGLKQNNSAAIDEIQGMIASLNEQIKTMESSGLDTSALTAQITQLRNISAILSANNANIHGMESYLTNIGQGIDELLQGATALKANYDVFDASISELVDSLSALIYRVSELSSAVKTLVSEYEKLDAGTNSYTNTVSSIVAGYSQVSDGTALLAATSGTLKSGTEKLYSGTGELLSGIVEIYNGTGTLTDGTGALDNGAAELLSGIAQLYNGTTALKDGTSLMREESASIDVQTKIDELLSSFTGGDAEITSFVSDKNTNVTSVQFVMQADGIQTAETTEPEAEDVKSLNFWQKLLQLFGI